MLCVVAYKEASDRGGLVDELGRWRLPVAGGIVTQLLVDEAFGFRIQQQEPIGHVTVEISCRFTFDDGNQRFEVDPEAKETLLPLLSLHKVIVSDAYAVKDGHLIVRFAEGRSIEVGPDDRYEAWEVHGTRPSITREFKIIAVPAGGLAVF
jgi:hypothetical protein